jgi:protein SCO1/2
MRAASVVVLVAALTLLTACRDAASKLPVYAQVPEFHLVDSFGHPFDGRLLAGKVWVADFIYTNCPGPCPRMTSQMHKIEKKFSGDDDVHLVSFSVDPARDTPPVLDAYAKHFGGAGPQWSFLTGDPKTIHILAHNVFMVGDLINVMDHSTKFMIVDRKGRIRGYYSTFDTDGINPIISDVNILRRSHS